MTILTGRSTAALSIVRAIAGRRRTRRSGGKLSLILGSGDAVSVVEAVQRDLATIAAVAPELAICTLAATALSLAEEMDGHNSATSKSMCAKALVDIMQELRALTPEQAKGDGVDELIARRAARLAG